MLEAQIDRGKGPVARVLVQNGTAQIGDSFIAGAVYCGIKYFDTDQVHLLIVYATIFACCIQFMVFSKVKYWQMLHRHNINRELKRLELRIAELTEMARSK